ncbi:Ubiquinone biosynthesis protein, variant 2 [Purpureocillium takamizusanense]|uniref:4-hydroxy-3-methoxy-5-polyprenylbenzoate decarboxylase n=1 Tax=Purpureocillium takamizusanense TaxID=2060973 RepID=A0A9Q8QT76_9HYPO|nr:Ubiquinone biosynthesis protein, variant 2 [Purpureocillium takamizusanense]UNI24239.1 Ubiquinone biosynthesis protein, variant 2 [Purpureocillium takamizusanense]
MISERPTKPHQSYNLQPAPATAHRPGLAVAAQPESPPAATRQAHDDQPWRRRCPRYGRRDYSTSPAPRPAPPAVPPPRLARRRRPHRRGGASPPSTARSQTTRAMCRSQRWSAWAWPSAPASCPCSTLIVTVRDSHPFFFPLCHDGRSCPPPWQAHLFAFLFFAQLTTVPLTLLADLIAATGEATATPYFIYRLRDAMLADATGRRILRQRPRITSETLSLARLRALPDNTVGRAYVGWLDREGVSPDTRAAVRYIDDPECAYVMQRYRECHDFYHAVTGLPVWREGEVALKAFEFANTLLPMTGLSMAAAATLEPQGRRRFLRVYLPWALRNGARSRELINVFWEEQLERDVDDLRAELGIERPPDLREIRKREREEKKRLKEIQAQGM